LRLATSTALAPGSPRIPEPLPCCSPRPPPPFSLSCRRQDASAGSAGLPPPVWAQAGAAQPGAQLRRGVRSLPDFLFVDWGCGEPRGSIAGRAGILPCPIVSRRILSCPVLCPCRDRGLCLPGLLPTLFLPLQSSLSTPTTELPLHAGRGHAPRVPPQPAPGPRDRCPLHVARRTRAQLLDGRGAPPGVVGR
jgi:hypothetical protein